MFLAFLDLTTEDGLGILPGSFVAIIHDRSERLRAAGMVKSLILHVYAVTALSDVSDRFYRTNVTTKVLTV